MTTCSTLENAQAPRKALSASWHLACVEGIDRGAVCPLPPPSSHETLTFGRACVAVSDPHTSRDHLVIRTDNSGARVHDCGSANGTVLRGRWRRIRLRSRQPRRMSPGHSIEIGNSRWELRPRPSRFPLPRAQGQSSDASLSITRPLRARLMPLIGGVMLAVSLIFSLRRIMGMWESSSGYSPFTVAAVLLAVIAVPVVRMWLRQRRYSPTSMNTRLWNDPAAVLLTLTHKAQHGQHERGQASSSSFPLSFPSADGARTVTLICDLWGDRTSVPYEEGLRADTHYCRFPAFYGENAVLHALYFAAFVSLPAGGATVICDPSIPSFPHQAGGTEPITLRCGNGGHGGSGDTGRQIIHCMASASCPICGEHLDPQIGHIGVARELGDLGAWWDYPIATQVPVSWNWIEQCFHVSTSDASQQHLPECVDAQELGCFDTSPAALPAVPNNSLSACIGMGYTEDTTPLPITVDMVTQGPHAVIVGTTGSGKSVALLTWILSLAARHRPDNLRIILIDYKGGATFSSLAPMPHVEAVLTDLHPGRTQRALLGVRTLLRQREHALAQAGFSDLSHWEASVNTDASIPPPPPRILLACDEFTALSSQHPEAFSLLMSLAAQGRSLGLHILLATQRPDHALTPGLLANIDLRLALRCREDSASQLLVGTADAAHLPRIPGRAILSDYGLVQCAWVRDVEEVVSSLLRTYRELPATEQTTLEPPPLWAPELPETLSWADLPACSSHREIPLGLVDGITCGKHDVLHWVGGHIRVEGSRRNSAHIAATVRALAHAIALERSLPLHVCSVVPEAWTEATLTDTDAPPAASVTSLVPCTDSSSTALLLDEVGSHGPCVVAVEDQSSLLRALERDTSMGTATSLWSNLLHNAAAYGITLIIGHPEQPSLWDREAGSISYRLLAAHHEHELQRMGITRAQPTDPYPGRYLLLNAPEKAHAFSELSSEGAYLQVHIPLDWQRQAPRCPSPHDDGSIWRVRSPQLLASTATPVPSLDEHRKELSATARLLVGANLEEFPLPSPETITIISENPRHHAQALGLFHTDNRPGPRLLAPHEWAQLGVSPLQTIIAFGVREEISRALTLKVGGNYPWLTRGLHDSRIGVLVHDGVLKRCVLGEVETSL